MRVAGENVGEYAMNQGDLSAGANYTLTFVGAKLTIAKATLTVTADNKSRQYGDLNPSFTATFAGFKFGQSLVTSGVTGVPALISSAEQSSPVGPYRHHDGTRHAGKRQLRVHLCERHTDR